ncbi:hypothetical protein KSP39_PZI006681 [Platanthera zijinensis]|uniref:Uncharacterized protein n=1 Tax=Platanthera zijinensis TaxID=2320716 RepID=A0AAP0BR77_9ASPA
MGNSLVRFLCGGCFKPLSGDHRFGFHGDAPAALAQDLHQFESTSEVPDGLSSHVVSSKKAQANWYAKIGKAWRKAKRPPQTPEEAARFIIQTLKGHQKADVEGLLAFYGLPLDPLSPPAAEVPSTTPPPKPEGAKVILHSLPVDLKSIADGDTVTVYVDAADRKESSIVPKEVRKAAAARAKAKAANDLKAAKTQHKIITDAGYRVVEGRKGHETLARKYRIRLRGIDAPENSDAVRKRS